MTFDTQEVQESAWISFVSLQFCSPAAGNTDGRFVSLPHNVNSGKSLNDNDRLRTKM